MRLLKEHRPILLFLAKFLGLYFVLNLAYGFYIESFGTLADPLTYWVTGQTISVLDLFYDGLDYEYYPYDTYIWMSLDKEVILNAYEGCNGINVLILFLSFIVAYQGKLKPSILFTIAGILIIHVSNILRIVLLFMVALKFPEYMYFTHKYLFTGIIYAVVFFLWYLWIKKVNKGVKGEEEMSE